MKNVFALKKAPLLRRGVIAILFSALSVFLGSTMMGCGTGVIASSTPLAELTFSTIANHTFGDAPFAISASSASSGAITYAVASGPATLGGNVITLTGVGVVSLRATQAAAANYPSQTATTSFSVSPAPVLSFSNITNHTYGDTPFAISASSASSGTITYAVLSGPATLTGNMVTLTGVGVVSLGATQAATTNYPLQTAAASFSVSPAPPVLTFSSIANHTFGDAPFAISASSASSGAITYAVASGPATLGGNIITLTGVGVVSLRATQAATTNYTSQTATTSFTANSSAPVQVTASQSSIYVNQTTLFSATSLGQTITGGQWVVLGGTSNGTIDLDGTFHAPGAAPNPETVAVGYVLGGQTYTGSINIENPAPSISAVSPTVLTHIHTLVTITGSGFLPTSTATLNLVPVQTSYVDSSHLTANINIQSPINASFQLAVTNLSSSSVTSTPITLSSRFQDITVTPQQLSGGPVTVNLSGTGFVSGSVVFIDGKPTQTVVNSSTSITATGFLAPWKTGSVVVELFTGEGTEGVSQTTIPIIPTAVSFDAAARFSTQAAFGPRPDVVMHIQQIGFDAFITEQINQPLATPLSATQNFMRTWQVNATQGNSLLRQRVAWALENIYVPKTQDADVSMIPFERTMEADSTGNFRKLIGDVTSDPNITTFLNLVNNSVPSDPTQQPNQNFARELLQLFTIGPNLLNEDGSTMVDAAGVPIPAYDQKTIIDLTRALTGWTYPAPMNQDFTVWGIDFTEPLLGTDYQHDHSAKLLFGSAILPSGQSVQQDRDMALDVIFNHPNVPPFISRRLIQHLVKSNPSPAYVQRISNVFKDDGTGVRGNLAAVLRAILLDPEARLGDTTPSPDDGFIQDPLLFEMFAMSTFQAQIGDGVGVWIPDILGEMWWNPDTVFGFVDPAFQIPGTAINAPEFALFNNISALQRSQILWGMISNNQPGFAPYANSSWLFQTFATVPDMVDALNHLAYHGRMSSTEQQVIVNYCAQMNPFLTTQQLQTALFLALNGDSYNVSN